MTIPTRQNRTAPTTGHTTLPPCIRTILAGFALLLCTAAVCAVPAAAAPDPAPAETWNAYVGHMVEKAPMALARGYAIINRLECEGFDVAALQATYASAKQHAIEGKIAFENGITSPAGNPVFQCKAETGALCGQIAACVGGGHSYTKGMIRAWQYAFPSFAEYADGL
ncbi:MAG: hypothetical protein GKC04_00435 [Methanomicrobiales archaeon]|nr:hypothetical protein [Methanomicrobiales archaeon]